MELQIYKGLGPTGVVLDPSYVIAKFDIDDRTVLVQKFLNENYICAYATVATLLDVTIGDYVNWYGIKYSINTIPNVTLNASGQYVYTIIFESEYYNFAKVQYRLSGQGDFYYMNNLEGFLDLFITNMNRVYSGWTKKAVDPCTQTNTGYRLLKFEAENCRSVLWRLCSEFNGEFSFNRKIVSFSDEQAYDTGLTFEYISNGTITGNLHSIQRKSRESNNLITRLYAFGSTKNLGPNYGKLRLELNTVAPLPIGLDYIDSTAGVAAYGIVEGAIIFDSVYPHWTGTVSSVASTVKFTDAAIDFDVNTHFIVGVAAKVSFLTGNCTGYTFNILSFTYTNPGGEFEIIPVILEDGTEIPNVTLHPGATNTYIIIDITMPEASISTAEAELQALAIDYLAIYDHPHVAYELEPDSQYMATVSDPTITNNLTVGGTITITDTDLGASVSARISELTSPLYSPYEYKISLTDQVEYIRSGDAQILAMAYKEATNATKKIAASPANDLGKSRRNWRDSEDLRIMVFDPDGYYYSASIHPLSIETTMLAAGSKSGNFELNGVVIKPNYVGDPTRLSITAGTLTHMGIDNAGADNIGTWTLVANATYEGANSLPVGTAYYVYAKCHKTNYTDAANQLILSATAYKADQTTYWYFLVGILHSTTGIIPRGISLSYGHTLINGGIITTGKIQSAGGATYFDLDNNTLVIAGGSSGGWVIDTTSMKDAAGTVGMSSTITGGDDIRFWAGHTTPTSAPFKVTRAGVLTASSGTVGGFTLSASALYAGSVATRVQMDTTSGIHLGATAFADAPFRVSLAGALVATSATITGAITANSGTVGSFTIGTYLYTGSKTAYNDANAGVHLGSDGIGIANNLFTVSAAGVLTAVSGTIGGCALAVSSIGSTTFVSGLLGSGWNISNTGTAEFQNAIIRGVIRTSVFEKDTISAINGIVLISKADVLATDMTAADTSTVVITGETTFVANEVIRIKDGASDEWMLVTNAAGAPTYIVNRDLAGIYGENLNPIWKKGTAVVSMGVGTGTKTGYVLLDSSSSNSPYMDIYGRNSNTYTDTTLHGRFGWLKGITDADVGLSATDVWGLYTDNAYIKGVIVANTGKIGGATGWVITAENIKDVAGVVGMSSTVTGGDDIRFWAGHATPASAPFKVTKTGALTATSVTIIGTIQTDTGAVGHYKRIKLDVSDNTFRVYNPTNDNVLYIDDDATFTGSPILYMGATKGGKIVLWKDAENNITIHSVPTVGGTTNRTDLKILSEEYTGSGILQIFGGAALVGNMIYTSGKDGNFAVNEDGDVTADGLVTAGLGLTVTTGNIVLSGVGATVDGIDISAHAASAVMDSDFGSTAGFCKIVSAGSYTHQSNGLTSAGIQFTDANGGEHTVVLNNGIIVTWTVA